MVPRGSPLNVRLISLLIGVAVLASACRIPNIDQAEASAPPLAQTSIVYAADGSILTTLHAEENRVVVPIDRVPMSLQHAVVAVEDRRFYEHKGVDLKAILRALYVNARSGRVVEGGSTITQQLVKNTIVGNDRTVSRKVREAMLAYQLEKRLTKDEILGRYMNTVYFGEGAYGIEAAAQTYFSHPASRLTLTQSATLAGIISAPADFDPVAHPKASKARRNFVLTEMKDQGYISPEVAARATARRLGLQSNSTHRYRAPYFVDYVKRLILRDKRFGATYRQRYDLLFKGGLRIYTTLDPKLQSYAETAVHEVLPFAADPYGAMTVLDPRTGQIRAMVGGRDFFAPKKDKYAKVNLATGQGGTGRQAGSSFKPFALVAALERGISPATTFPAPGTIDIPMPDGQPVWHVQNYDGSGRGNLTMEQATISSVNVVYAQIIRAIGDGDPILGARRVVAVARDMGITSKLRGLPSAVLGTNEVNTLEMASAYGGFATDGVRHRPVAINRITNASGTVIFRERAGGQQVLNPAIAWVANQILQKVVQSGTGVAAQLPRPVGGKTGTAQQWRDAWFVGFIPQLVGAVWVGFPKGQISMTAPTVRLSHVVGGSWPAQIWHAFMVRATADLGILDFPTPSIRFVSVQVDITRGCLPNQFTPPDVIRTIQVPAGTEPHEKCKEPTKPQLITVPSVVGLTGDAAAAALGQAGFQTSTVTQYTQSVPAGTVIAQDPAAGASVLQGSTVTITVATHKQPTPTNVTVPNVIGLTKSDAIAALQQDGFAVVIHTEWECTPKSCGADPGHVWKQSPGGGSSSPVGSTVDIWVNPQGG